MESKDHRLGRSESVMWKAGTSKVVAPPVLVKNRWVGPREQVLNVPVAYLYMGPVSLIAYHQRAWLKPIVSMIVWGLVDRLAGVLKM
jgi:hypothetical protein